MTTATKLTASTTPSYQHSETIPTTHETALAAVAEQDALRWGEQEREPSRRMHASDSLGLLLTTLYSRAECDDHPMAAALERAAKIARTPADDAELRKGG